MQLALQSSLGAGMPACGHAGLVQQRPLPLHIEYAPSAAGKRLEALCNSKPPPPPPAPAATGLPALMDAPAVAAPSAPPKLPLLGDSPAGATKHCEPAGGEVEKKAVVISPAVSALAAKINKARQGIKALGRVRTKGAVTTAFMHTRMHT